MRGRQEEFLDLFRKAYAEDRVKALQVLLYLRDCRSGQGEKAVFRNTLQALKEDLDGQALLEAVDEYGCYKDLFEILTPQEAAKVIGPVIAQHKDTKKTQRHIPSLRSGCHLSQVQGLPMVSL